MVPDRSALDFLPETMDYPSLRAASVSCKGCELYLNATQTVFGEGPVDAEILMVGEVPGNDEDRSGHPFVGPAGRLLDKAMIEAGIDRSSVYMTNAVKHFKSKPYGMRRLHQKPSASEILACKPWLLSEIDVVRPRIIVCLGATAAQTLLGNKFRVTRSRGQWIDFGGGTQIIATIHPSAVLRTPEAGRKAEYEHFVADLGMVARTIARSSSRGDHA